MQTVSANSEYDVVQAVSWCQNLSFSPIRDFVTNNILVSHELNHKRGTPKSNPIRPSHVLQPCNAFRMMNTNTPTRIRTIAFRVKIYQRFDGIRTHFIYKATQAKWERFFHG